MIHSFILSDKQLIKEEAKSLAVTLLLLFLSEIFADFVFMVLAYIEIPDTVIIVFRCSFSTGRGSDNIVHFKLDDLKLGIRIFFHFIQKPPF